MTSHTTVTAIAVIAGLALLSATAGADARGLRSSNVAAASSSTGSNTGTVRQINAAVTSTRAPQAVGSWRYQKRGCHRPGC